MDNPRRGSLSRCLEIIESKLESINNMLPEWLRSYNLLSMVPLMLLLTYYPQLYSEDLAVQIFKPTSPNQKSWWTGAGIVLIIGPLFLFVLSKYSLLSNPFDSQETPNASIEQPDDSGEEAPNSPIPYSTSLQSGLTSAEVKAQRARFGRNELATRKNWFHYLWQFSKHPAHIMIEAQFVLTVLLSQWTHVGPLCVLTVLLARSVIVPEREADDVVISLSWDANELTIVLRNGVISEVPIGDIVPGDVVHVSKGSQIPADSLVVSVDGTLSTDQSAITGKSLAIEKYEGDFCYASTGVLQGDAFLMVQTTGKDTFIGRTASLVRGTTQPNPRKPHVLEYQAILMSIGKTLVAMALILCAKVYTLNACPTRDMLVLAVGLAIVMIRYSTTTSTVSHRARGSAMLAEDVGCVAQNIDAIDALAGIDVLCSDKTGTLTGNRLTVMEPLCLSCEPEEIMLVAALTCPDPEDPDPIDRAILSALKRFPQAKAEVDRHKILDSEPFNPDTMVMHCLVETPPGEHIICLKGSPKAVFAKCPSIDSSLEEKYKDACRDNARRGYRVLGVACQRENETWQLLGGIPMYDPPRFDTVPTIELAKSLGVHVKVMTGDAEVIAESFSKDSGIGGKVFNGPRLEEAESKDDANLSVDVEAAGVFAEVGPETKEKIVETLQNHGHRVGVTGDGTDDSGSLRLAYCGIAVEGAAETAQSASDVVFLKPGLNVLVRSIQIARQVFQEMYNLTALQFTREIQMMLVMGWNFSMHREILPLPFLLLSNDLPSLLASFFPTSYTVVPHSSSPARWSFKKLVFDTAPLILILTACTILSQKAINEGLKFGSNTLIIAPSGRTSSTQSSALALSCLLSGFWLELIMHTDGRFWAYNLNYRRFSILSGIYLLATGIFVSGWAGELYHIDAMTAAWVWVTSLVSFVLAAGARYALSDGSLVNPAPEVKGRTD